MGPLDAAGMQPSYFTPTRMDAIAVGCCLAFLATSPAFRRRALATSGRTATAVLLGVAVVLGALWALFTYLEGRGADCPELVRGVKGVAFDTVKPLLLACLVWVCVTRPADWFGKILNARPIAFLGRLSFGIYLWQQPLLNPWRDHWAFRFPVNLVCVLAAALLSYWLVEQPFLRLKDRFRR
jgi:peptidoglycan/LPS O-acetylase OafA/YrhL